MPQLRLLGQVARCQALIRACDAHMRGGMGVGVVLGKEWLGGGASGGGAEERERERERKRERESEGVRERSFIGNQEVTEGR